METARVGGRMLLTAVAYIDTIPLSATNAAGGTRVIGVGCRYYTTLRRGVFILPSGSHRELDRRTYLYHLCHRCLLRRPCR